VKTNTAFTAALRRVLDFNDERCAGRVKLKAENWADSLGVPIYFLELLLMIEDKRFPVHIGIDSLAILRALHHNVFRRTCLQGASTITQQIYNTRNANATSHNRRSLRSKVRQVAFALRNQRRMSKFGILREYLEEVYWGRDFRGIAAAAYGYFDLPPKALDVEQSFILAERLACPNRVPGSRIRVILSRRAIRRILESNSFSHQRLIGYYEKIGFTVDTGICEQ
jgi:membrane peptidoglycan carboxypeptidase